jgi:hypothetical protein
MSLDALCSLLWMKNGEPQEEHFEKAETHLLNLWGFLTLDALCSLLCMKNGEPQEEHFEKAETHL